MTSKDNNILDANEQQVFELLEELGVADVSMEKLPLLSDEIVESIYSFGYAYYEKGLYPDAEILFRLLTALRMRSYKYWMGLGAAFQMQKKYPEAVEAYSWAAVNEKTMTDPYPHLHGAECLYSSNQLQKALQALHSAKLIAKRQGNYQILLSQIEFLEQVWKKKVNHGRIKR